MPGQTLGIGDEALEHPGQRLTAERQLGGFLPTSLLGSLELVTFLVVTSYFSVIKACQEATGGRSCFSGLSLRDRVARKAWRQVALW